jgi:alkanesulfonate monooxygenase SsuD/methylene tetrahydromethanopterin reductase-like flavin-dependent oxidoreductase (luciferase family)
MPFERIEHWAAVGSAQRVAEQIDAHRQAGVEEFVLTLMSDNPLEQIERLSPVRELCSAQ